MSDSQVPPSTPGPASSGPGEGSSSVDSVPAIQETSTKDPSVSSIQETSTQDPPIVLIKTTMGRFSVELYMDEAPRACRNFMRHVRGGYYNDTHFHRVIPGFMIQGGDPTGTGRGGKSIWGKPFPDEITNLKHVGAGVLSMANSGPNTNGSQWFITLAPTPWLDGRHTVFGRVRDGLSVIEKIGNVETGEDDSPVENVTILGAYL